MKNQSNSMRGSKCADNAITSICRIKPLAPAFSLMEMMVVMLVVAVVMALAAPMVSKKLSNHSGSAGGSLLTSVAGGNVAYNLDGENRAVIYGGDADEISSMASYISSIPRLILNGGKSTSEGVEYDTPQIGFMYASSNPDDPNDPAAQATGTMLLGNNNRIYIGNNATVPLAVNNSIAIGQNVKGGANSILIGGMSNNELTADDAVAIGHEVRASSSSVSLGAGANAGSSGVAIGRSTSAGSGVAIGYASAGGGVAISGKNDEGRASAGGGVALGANTVAGGTLALGYNANVNSTGCYAIGAEAVCPENPTDSEAFRDPVYIGGRSNIVLSGGRLSSSTSNNTLLKPGSRGLSISGSVTIPQPHPDGAENPLEEGLNVEYTFSPSSLTAETISATYSVSAGIGNFNNINDRLNDLSNMVNDNLASWNTQRDNHLDYLEDVVIHHYYYNDYVYHCIYWLSGTSDAGLAEFAYCKDNKCGTLPMLAFNYSSDERLKDIIGENLDAMDKINRLKVYDFTFKDDETKTKRVGVIAQELQKFFPNAVTEGEDGYLQIRHEDIFYAMVRGLQELDAKVKKLTVDVSEHIKVVAANRIAVVELKSKLDAQDKEIAKFKKDIADLKKIVKKLERD